MRIAELRRRMTEHFGADWAPSYAKDFVMAELGGQTVDQAVIDFLRKYFSGRSDSKSYEIRKNMNNYSEINPSTQSQNAINEFPIDLTSFLKGRTKLIVEKYSQGFTFKGIGNEIGVTESRAHQIFSDYVDKMLILLTVPKEVRHWAAKNVF